MPLTAFITDGSERPTLAIVRALGRRGIRTIVGDEQPVSLASCSKYCARHVTYPSPYRNPEGFQSFLVDFLARERVDVVMPVTDVTTHAICLNQEQLRRVCALAVPPFDAFETVTNKATLAECAASCGIPIPRTHVVHGLQGLREVLHHVEYPAVVKPVRSRILTDRGWVWGGAQYADSQRELWRLYQHHEYLASYPSLIQERIVGPGVGVFVLFDRGQPIIDFAHRRLREKPPAGGASVLSESTPVDARLREYAIRMLGPIGWHGVAMMEYKQDCRTGRFYLMEVNGRFWGSLELAVAAGVDFPFLAFRLALGHRADAIAPYKVGVKNRWLLGDVDHLLLRLFRNASELRLPESSPSKWQTLVDFLRLAEPGLHYEIVSGDDPRPFLHELSQNTRSLSAAAMRFAAHFTRTEEQGPRWSSSQKTYESTGTDG